MHVQFLLLGLGGGAVFAALAMALVVVYRSSGVINFATGSMALFGAYVYAFMRKGELLILVPGFPKTVDVGGDPGFFVAAVVAVMFSGVLGLVLYVVVFRPLRTAPPLARAVASIGLMVLFVALAGLRVGSAAIGVDPIFPTDVWEFAGVRLPQDRVYFAVTVVLIAALLACLFRFTRFGLATRATAESEEGALVSGLSPDRIAAYNWTIGSAVAGLAGVLISPLVPLTPAAYTLFIVPALAAAIIGRFASVIGAVAAGLGIGMLQAEATFLSREFDWLPSTGLVELVPLIVILLVLVVQARPLPSRGAILSADLGSAPYPRRVLLTTVVAVVMAVAALTVLSGDWRTGLITSLILGVIGLSQVVVTGYAGQVSLAQLAIAGAAAFAVGPITEDWGVPFPIAPVVAASIATVLGVIVGIPALRIRGLTVAVVTLAFAYAIEALVFRNADIVGSGGIDVPSPTIFGYDLGIGTGAEYPRLSFGLLCLAVLTLVALSVAALRRSRLGTRMLAVRANERSAAASGIDVVRTKLIAFAIGAFIAGLGGCLMAYQQTNVSFQPFMALTGVTLFATVYLAGITSISGGLVSGLLAGGGLLIVLLDRVLDSGQWYQVIVGIGLILTVLLNPEGIVAPAHRAARRFRKPPVRSRVGSIVAEPVSPADRNVVEFGEPVLSLKGVSVRYGGVAAVDDVSFEVPRGAIVGLIGPNGAGKTTLIDAISGFSPAAGDISLDGTQLDGKSPYRRIRAGLGRTFQAIELYEDLSVRENVLVGLPQRGGRRGTNEVDAVLELLGLGEVHAVAAGELSQGQRQLVSIARAIAGSPTVLLLDEPAGGLDPTESLWLAERLRAIRDSGVTILMVEHDMSLVLSVCDRIQVLNFGRTLASGTPAEIRSNRQVAEAYLGSTHAVVRQ
ncbi:branched-chain amino acid ABC transporter permease/ATP-binding protein [Aldersonia kunmingensis]|uniref:branched-chain amino acid ABC transporter permease/ATP-binding protein n=1 Tax=Aldersonia kunmingensis TaxID=408066 RepID=UPI001FE1A42D|nr:branched-chain amino acid ABC transporter permease/ATP-binding protein [Aldersonia kunmingensis]